MSIACLLNCIRAIFAPDSLERCTCCDHCRPNCGGPDICRNCDNWTNTTSKVNKPSRKPYNERNTKSHTSSSCGAEKRYYPVF